MCLPIFSSHVFHLKVCIMHTFHETFTTVMSFIFVYIVFLLLRFPNHPTGASFGSDICDDIKRF